MSSLIGRQRRRSGWKPVLLLVIYVDMDDDVATIVVALRIPILPDDGGRPRRPPGPGLEPRGYHRRYHRRCRLVGSLVHRLYSTSGHAARPHPGPLCPEAQDLPSSLFYVFPSNLSLKSRHVPHNRAHSLPNRPSSTFGVRAPVMRPSNKKTVVANMGAIEVAQVAGEAGYIGGVAGVMFGITLVGLALGFVLLRVESLAEEGKI